MRWRIHWRATNIGQLHVQLDFAHLERASNAEWRIRVPDQPCIITHGLRTFAVRHPRSLHDGRIVTHVIDDTDKAVIEHWKDFVQTILKRA